MKKFIAVLSAVLTASGGLSLIPFRADAAESVYEFENGVIYDTGENVTAAVSLSGASGGKAVDLRDSGDSVTLDINAESSGVYKLNIRYSQPYDEAGKYQDVIVNGQDAGQIFCGYTGEGKYNTASISANLKKGANTVTVQASWGWTYLDCLTIGGSASSSASVSAKLSNPNASAQTQSLYAFLCDTYGNYVISGQQESTWMGSENYEFDIIKSASGKYPALRGLDYMGDDFSGCNRRAKLWYQQGGIVTICWHCGSDFKGSHTESMNTNLNWDKALTPGTSEYNALIAGMDKGAKALLELKEAGVPVIWRPFHEFDGKWFWWGKGGAENFKKLWQIMYERYTDHWGLDNLIWNLGYCGDVNNGWYPGDEYVDIIGADTYVNHTNSLVNIYSKTAGVADKPVCLHENGPIPDPEKMRADGAKWLWFMTWHTSFIDSNEFNTAEYIKRIYNSDYMLTLDELPDVYNYKVTVSEPETVKGDVNGDGTFSVADLVLMQKWLLGAEDAELADWQAGDLSENGKLDIFDLMKMRRLLLSESAGENTGAPETSAPQKQEYSYDPAKKYAEYPNSYKSQIPQTGKVVKENYNGINGNNSLNVYLPYGYDQNKKYNVFYFMHGMWDDENSLFFKDDGEMQRVLDNMIQNGDIEPMIVVTPTFNKSNPENVWKEVRQSVIPFIESKYSTYAESVTEDGLKASRMHRAYGGFSMGSVSTWAAFENCVDIIGYFMPLSGAHHWGSGNADPWALTRAVDRAGLKKDEYFIMSATGTSDFAVDNLSAQIEEMKKLDHFVFTSDFSKGNLWYMLVNGGQHDWFYVREYLYNCLPFFFHE